jgi:two-component system, OmpR family, response regulator BaeR
MNGTVLIVEDEEKIATVVADYLRAASFDAIHVTDGQAALAACDRHAVDVVLLDLNLPRVDGLEVCRSLRRGAHCDIGIIMMTARIAELERLLGLEVGADDYVCKPFSPREVVARVQSLLRRRRAKFTQAGAAHGLLIDADGQRAFCGGQLLPLTSIEWRLLSTLVAGAGRIYSRAQLLDLVHVEFRSVSDRAIDSHIKNVRRKLADAAPNGDCIVSVYGLGYRFDRSTLEAPSLPL